MAFQERCKIHSIREMVRETTLDNFLIANIRDASYLGFTAFFVFFIYSSKSISVRVNWWFQEARVNYPRKLSNEDIRIFRCSFLTKNLAR